jgi:hypothetical protein
MGLSTAQDAKTDQPTAEERETGRFGYRRDGRSQEAADLEPDPRTPGDLSGIIDATGYCRLRAGHINRGEDATRIEEAVCSRAVVKPPDDLPRTVYAKRPCIGCAGNVNRCEDTTRIEEAVLYPDGREAPAGRVRADDYPRVVDPSGGCIGCPGRPFLGSQRTPPQSTPCRLSVLSTGSSGYLREAEQDLRHHRGEIMSPDKAASCTLLWNAAAEMSRSNGRGAEWNRLQLMDARWSGHLSAAGLIYFYPGLPVGRLRKR